MRHIPEYRRDDYFFPREQARYSPQLEKSPVPEPWWKVVAGGIGTLIFIAVIVVIF